MNKTKIRKKKKKETTPTPTSCVQDIQNDLE